MEQKLARDLRLFWNKHENTNAELVVFAASLNPPLIVDPGHATTVMLNALIDHVDRENIVLVHGTGYLGETFYQQTNITGADEPAGQADNGAAPSPGEENQSSEDGQLQGEGIPGPEERQEQPARHEAHDLGRPSPALVGAGAPSPPPPPPIPGERIDNLPEVFDKLEQLFALPPAHQNVITAMQREQHEKGMQLISQGRQLLPMQDSG